MESVKLAEGSFNRFHMKLLLVQDPLFIRTIHILSRPLSINLTETKYKIDRERQAKHIIMYADYISLPSHVQGLEMITFIIYNP